MNRGLFDEALLGPVLVAQEHPSLRRRALGVLGVMRLAREQYAEGFSTWREAVGLTDRPGVGMDLGQRPEDPRAAVLYDLRECLNSLADPGVEQAWGFGGPRMIVPLFALSELLEGQNAAAARLVRTEAEARLASGSAVSGEVDPETGDTTEDLLLELAEMLESKGLDAIARRVREVFPG